VLGVVAAGFPVRVEAALPQRLAQLVEAQILGVHAYQVHLFRESGKGDPACYAGGALTDADLATLEGHQSALLAGDVASVRAWAEGRESSFDPAKDLAPLLDSGLALPVSTGSDWFLCSSNRVYVDVGADFSYEAWLDGLCSGRTFITNGPLLRLTVDGRAPATEPLDSRRATARVAVEWSGAQPIDRIEIVRDGEVVAGNANLGGASWGTFATDVAVHGARWLAARCSGRARTSYGHALWAHTSPVYLNTRPAAAPARRAAAQFLAGIEEATTWIRTKARFDDTAQRDRMLQLFAEGRDRFTALRDG